MKILFVTLMIGEPWGGSEELWAKVAETAINNNCEVNISVKKWDFIPAKLQKLADLGAVLNFREEMTPKKKTLFKKIYRKIIPKEEIIKSEWEIINELKPDLVVISMGSTYDIMWNYDLYNIIKTAKIPFYLIPQLNYENNNLSPYDREIAKDIFINAKYIFFISNRNKIVVERDLAIKLNNVFITNNPILIDNKKLLPYPTTTKIKMACVARLDTYYKQQNILLDLLSSDKWRRRDWELNFYGKGKDKEYLEELIDLYNLSDKVYIRGHIESIETVWAYNHILLLPSYAEGTPLSLIEAMYLGRTAVASDVGGNSELIEDGINGYISDCGNVNSFGNKLEIAWNNQQDWEKMGINAFNSISSKIDAFSHETIFNQLLKR